MCPEELIFEFKFEINGAGVEIPTLKDIEFFEKISLLFRAKKVERHTTVPFKVIKTPPLLTPLSTHSFIGFFPFIFGYQCP